MKATLGCLCLLILISLSVLADEHDHQHMGGEQLGHVNFPVSCSAPAQEQFNRAVALLHSFGYERSFLAFNEVIKTDAECAMGYWGMAMTYYHPIWAPPNAEQLKKGLEAIERAKITGKPSARELAYISALEVFYTNSESTGHMERARAYSDAMKKVAHDYAEDDEAMIFYALALRGTAPPNDKTYVIQKESAEILNSVLKKEPEHPGVAHYLIHCFDYPELAEVALPAARIYSKIAPSSPHALHMPSHIFTRLGYWQESIDSNIASANTAIEITQKIHPGAGSFDQLHAMDYLMYAYMQLGQDDKAKQVLMEMNGIKKLDANEFSAGYAFAAIPVRFALERGKWSEAASISAGFPWFPWQKFPYAEAITYYGRAIGEARTGQVESAKKDATHLDELHQAAVNLKDPSYDWPRQVEIQQKTVGAWIAFAEKKNEEALSGMRAVADLEDATDKHPVTPGSLLPAREQLGDMLMELNRPAEAMAEYEKSLGPNPNRFYALNGAAKAAKRSGNQEKAATYYGKLIELCGTGCQRPEAAEARSFLAKN